MLADPRADALVSNFAGQWLFLRELKNARPDSPDFDGNLRQSFQRETELLFRTILREDRSIVDLLDADFTFVDERLARHYGIPGIRGSRMRRVTLPADSPRRGLLGQGSILTRDLGRQPHVAGRARQVGAREPARRAAAAAAAGRRDEPREGRGKVKATTLRQRLEQHRANAACASCHRLMDPIGFALENFDHAGKWRTVDGADADRRHAASWWTAPSSTAPSRCAARCWRARTCSPTWRRRSC